MAEAAAIDPAKAAAALELLRAVDSAGPRAAVVGLTQMEGGWSRHTYAIDVEDPELRTRIHAILREMAGRELAVLATRPEGSSKR